jgi:uncharacterized alkaline shock family protein YloU
MENLDVSSESSEDQPTLGDIKVNHSVVASIVRLAALEVKGVCGVGAGIVDGIADLFSKRESDRGVKITEDDEERYSIEIRLVIAFGAELAKTAYQVQMAIRKQLEVMTGKGVRRVDVIIEGVKMVTDRKASESESDEVWPELPQTD